MRYTKAKNSRTLCSPNVSFPFLSRSLLLLHGCYGRKYSLLTMFLRFSPQYFTVLSRVYHIEAKLYLVREEGKELHTLSSCKRNIVETLKLVYCMSMYSRKGCICLYFQGGATKCTYLFPWQISPLQLCAWSKYFIRERQMLVERFDTFHKLHIVCRGPRNTIQYIS